MEKTRATTKQWFECGDCNTKMETMKINSSDTFDIFGMGSASKCFYCNNSKCIKFGYLTVAGIKKEE